MARYLYILGLICTYIIISGCQSKALQMIIEPQEWENLAVAEGVTCTAPEMIDGDLKTVGYAEGGWIHLKLPTRKAIHRIVLRGTNITDAIVYQKIEGNQRWPAILQIQNNRSNVIQMRRSFVTEALRIYVSGTMEDKRQPPLLSPRHDLIVRHKGLGKPFIQEIEVYGFASKDKK